MSRHAGAFLLSIALVASAPAHAQKAWDDHKSDCDAVFAGWEKASSAALKRCVSLWEAYRDAKKVDAAQRRQVVPAFERLCREPEPEAAFLARQALLRLGVVPPAAQPAATASPGAAQAPAAREPARVVTDADRKASEALRTQGMARYKKKDWDGALALFHQALDRDPGNVQALYDAACTAGLAGRADVAAGFLDRLTANGTKPAMTKVRKSWRDADFDPIRHEPAFKRASGWARVKVLHGMGGGDFKALGEDNAYKLAEMLAGERLGFEAVEGGADRWMRDRPHVWFKPHAEASAYVVAELIGHPRTRVVPIDWDTEWDVVVSWADRPVDDGKGGQEVQYSMLRKDASGRSPEERLDGAIQSKDEALAKPDAYVSKARSVVSEPGKTVDQLEGTLEGAKGTVDKAAKSVDKVKGLFK